MSQNRGNVGTVSRILATLIMAAIIVAGPLVVYSWITGYIEFSKSGPAITIQSIVNDPTGTDLLVYVQNVGDGVVRLAEDACLYVDEARSLVKTFNGAYAIVGGTKPLSSGNENIFFVKTTEHTVIPEYQSWIAPSLLFAATLAVVAYKKRIDHRR